MALEPINSATSRKDPNVRSLSAKSDDKTPDKNKPQVQIRTEDPPSWENDKKQNVFTRRWGINE